MQNKLFIISNESIFHSQNSFFCDNLDMKSMPEGLKQKFDVNIIARNSNKERSHKINIEKIKIHKNILGFLFSIFKSFKEKNPKYLIISISPFTFFASILFALFRKKPIVYLRSDGYEEYRAKFGFVGSFIYHFMFTLTSKVSKLLGCDKKVLRGKEGQIIHPSQLSKDWFLNITKPSLESIKLLYIGRLRIEKGIFSLLKILKKNKSSAYLSIVGAEKNTKAKIDQQNVSINEIETKELNLIKFYDKHNIFVLPSFTEGHPMVVLEALARNRPVVIFEEIRHIVKDRKGIFVAERNSESFFNTINHIMNNYQSIVDEIKKNKLPTKQEFIKNLSTHIL